MRRQIPLKFCPVLFIPLIASPGARFSGDQHHRVWRQHAEACPPGSPGLARTVGHYELEPTKAYHLRGGGTDLHEDMATLESMPATFTPAEVIDAGMSRQVVYAWRDAGQVIELSRGVYRKADAPETAYLDVIAATKRAPRAIVCLVSALAIHDLTDEVPPAVQLAVPRGVHPPQISYPPVDFSRFDPSTFIIGKEDFEAAPGEFVPVYSPERAVADCMRLRHRVGDIIAIRALRTYLSKRQNQAGDLMAVARRLGDATALAHTIQVVLS